MNTITYYKQNVWFEALKELKQLVRVFWYLHCNAMQQGSAQVWRGRYVLEGMTRTESWSPAAVGIVYSSSALVNEGAASESGGKTESLELRVIFGCNFFKKAALEYSGVWWDVCNPVPEQVKISSFSKLEISPLKKGRYRHGHRFYMYI